jgi:hypothetical protein
MAAPQLQLRAANVHLNGSAARDLSASRLLPRLSTAAQPWRKPNLPLGFVGERGAGNAD